MITTSIALTEAQKQIVLQLWNDEYPAKLELKSLADLDNYLRPLADLTHYFLQNESGETEGWAITFLRDQERWFALIIGGNVHGQGKGKEMLDKLKEDNEVLNGWVTDHNNDIKLNGETYISPVGFYLKNGFEVFWDERLELPVMSAAKMKWVAG